jgi:hypothetical protein
MGVAFFLFLLFPNVAVARKIVLFGPEDSPQRGEYPGESYVPGVKGLIRFKSVALNADLADFGMVEAGDELWISGFAESAYSAIVDRVVRYDALNTVSVRARMVGYPLASVVISSDPDQSLVKIVIPELNKEYTVVRDEAMGGYVLLEINLFEKDEVVPAPPVVIPDIQDVSLVRDAGIEDGIPDETTVVDVDVMVVYTNAAASWASGMGGIQNVINQAMEYAVLTHENSDTKINLRLVHTAQVTYVESGNSQLDLIRLRGESDGFLDEVHGWRNTYHADFVAMLTDVEDTGGIGYLLSFKSGQASTAFSITRVQQAAEGSTFVHEVGHNMGAHHHKGQNFQPGPTTFGDWSANIWSAGWRWEGSNSQMYCTVMTYSAGQYFVDGRNATRVAYFSNPDIQLSGTPVGNSLDGNNARTLRELRAVCAAYRGAPGIPRVTTHPSNATVKVGGNAAFRVEGSGTAPLGYQWQLSTNKGGTWGNVIDEIGATLTVNSVTSGMNGHLYRCLVSNSLGSATSNSATLMVAVNLNPALGGGLDFSTGGDAPWVIDSGNSRDGSAGKSGGVTHDQSSWVEASLTGPGTLIWWWSVSSEMDYDGLQVLLNGSAHPGLSISGSHDWSEETLEIPAGSHTVRWVYAKDESADAGSDCGWLDSVQWVSLHAPLLRNIGNQSIHAGGNLSFEVLADDEDGDPLEYSAEGSR